MANGDKNGVTSNVQPPGSSAGEQPKKKRGRKAGGDGSSVPEIPTTVFGSAELAIGQQPDNDKAKMYTFIYPSKKGGVEVKAALFTWALTSRDANSNFLKAFQPAGVTDMVSANEQLRLMKRALAKERGEQAGEQKESKESKETKETVTA